MEVQKGIKQIVAYVVTLLIVFFLAGVCFFTRFDFNFYAPIDNWVNTASFFNSILTPPLLAITSILIFLTWQTSKKELEETKELLKIQSETQNFKDDLDIFSRRVRELSLIENECFPQNNKFMINSYLLHFLNNDDELYQRIYNWIPDLKRIDQEKKPSFLANYIVELEINLTEAVRAYLHIRESDKDLIIQIDENIDQHYVINFIAGYLFFQSNKGKLWLHSLSRLLEKCIEEKIKLRGKYLDELFFNMNSDFLLDCINNLSELALEEEQKRLFINYINNETG